MKMIYEIRLTRNRAIAAYLKKEQATMKDLPMFSELLTELEENILEVERLMEVYSLNITGITKDKSNLKKNIADRALEVSARLTAFARFRGSNSLLREIRFNKSDLARMSDNALISAADTLYQRATEYAHDLESFGQTGQATEELYSKLNQFRESRVDPRLARSNKTKVKSQIIECFRRMDNTLEKLDALMHMLQLSSPEIFEGYLTARRMVNLGKTRMVLRGKVTDSLTLIPVAGVKIRLSLTGTGSRPVAELVSASRGYFRMKTLPAGSYDFLATKRGFHTKSGSFIIGEKQQPVSLDLVLDRELT